ncbi:MAG: glycosyl hydrolase-related protein [Sedimentisphaeraceae bacterium JB056]
MKTAKKKIHIVTYTHWDREFRFDFETTRMWLVRLWDNLLEIMRNNAEFKYFMPDGQFILVEDYLEIRPERTEEIKDLVKNGRLQIGPWYTLADSSSVNGESLIRNLMTGLKKSRDFGGAMEVGYNVFSFGQISQLPQVYAGFGIDTIIFYKHMDRSRSRYDEFIWQGPDGTKALATRLGREARWNFFFAGHIPIVYDRDPWDKDWQYKFGEMGKSFHFCEPDNYSDFHFITEPQTSYHEGNIKHGFERTLATLKDTAVPEHLLFFDGTDFTEPHPDTPSILEHAREIFGDEYEIVHSTLEDYIKAIKPLLKDRDIDTITGHMKDGPAGSIHTDVLSVHPELQKINSEAENMLFRQAEPFAAAAWMLGYQYPNTYIEKALNLMFKSHAHDSIQGVGPWTLSAGVEHRLLQAKIIAGNLATDSIQKLTAKIDTSGCDDSELFLIVYNPSSFSRSDVVEAYIDIPRDWNVENLVFTDSSGTEIDCYELERVTKTAGLYHPRSRNMPIYVNRYHLLLNVKDIPAVGYKTVKINYKEQAMYPYPHEGFDKVNIPHSPIASDSRNAENEYFKLYIASDGTLEILNKKTGKQYKKLNYFLDEGQNGNQQRCYPPKIDKVITTLGKPASIAITINTDLLAVFEIATEMLLPKYFDQAKNRRSSEETVVPIKSIVTIKKDSPVVEIETTVDNKVKDHFLRVCFESGIKSDITYSTEVFNTEKHKTAASRDGKWQGSELRRHQQHLFMSINDDTDGLTILNDSLRDYEILNHNTGLIAQSIVRGVELKIPCDNRFWLEYPDDGSTQSLRKHTTRYGIFVHEGDWQNAGAYKESLAFNVPLRISQISKQSGTLPLEKSFFEIASGQLVLSCIKKAENTDGIVVRMYNPTDETIKTSLRLGFDIKEAFLTRLDETRVSGLKLKNKSEIEICIGSRKIVSYEIIC